MALEQLAYDGEHGGGLRLSGGVGRRQPRLSPSLAESQFSPPASSAPPQDSPCPLATSRKLGAPSVK